MKIAPHFKLYALIPAVILVAAVIFGILMGGFNLGIDFTGGSLITVDMGQTFEVSDVEAAVRKAGNGADFNVAQTGELGNISQAAIRIQDLGSEEAEDTFREELLLALRAQYPDAQAISTERVGAVAGETLVQNAILSVVVASILMLLYIWIRFELVSGVVAIITCILNILLLLASMIFCRSFVQLNSSFIAACLTIVGYSINNTIIVLDRIREENRKYARSTCSRKEVAEIAVKKCMGRMVNTTITSLLTITMLYILGVDSIREFALPLILGIAFGAYISIFIAPALWGIWMDKKGTSTHRRSKKVRRAAAR